MKFASNILRVLVIFSLGYFAGGIIARRQMDRLERAAFDMGALAGSVKTTEAINSGKPMDPNILPGAAWAYYQSVKGGAK